MRKIVVCFLVSCGMFTAYTRAFQPMNQLQQPHWSKLLGSTMSTSQQTRSSSCLAMGSSSSAAAASSSSVQSVPSSTEDPKHSTKPQAMASGYSQVMDMKEAIQQQETSKMVMSCPMAALPMMTKTRLAIEMRLSVKRRPCL